MKQNKICENCKKEFIPSKNDCRIKFCSDCCRNAYRLKNNYMKKYYSSNIEKWKTRQSNSEYRQRKNSARRLKYQNDEQYRKRTIENVKKYRIKHPTYKRESDLKSKYNITLKNYNEMLESQNGGCAICGVKPNTENNKKILFVDHDHKNGKIRGLLCQSCNFGIGIFKDNIKILENAVNYLKGE